MSERSVLVLGAVVGAAVGAGAAFLFMTEGGRRVRDRMEPAVDDLRREFGRFQRTAEKVGDMANEGLRVVNEFKVARGHESPGTTSH